jgi:hypothetical protein
MSVSIGDEVQAVRKLHPAWAFEQSWNHVMAVRPDLKTSTVESNRIEAKLAHFQERAKWKTEVQVEAAARQLMSADPRLCYGAALKCVRGEDPEPKAGQDPRIAEALGKLKILEDDKSEAGIQRHVKFLGEVKKLLSRDTSMTHSEAINRVIREHPELWPTKAMARHRGSPGQTLVECEYSVPLVGKCPAEIMYMPAGKSTIRANVNGRAKEITVDVSPMTTGLLQASLLRLLAEPVTPFIDFLHRGEEATAMPKGFRWTPEGVMMSLDWTSAGKAAVEGNTYRWFSLTFLLNEAGNPAGLPETGPVGAFTNNPAFRRMKSLEV